jgi:hypothetical protein
VAPQEGLSTMELVNFFYSSSSIFPLYVGHPAPNLLLIYLSLSSRSFSSFYSSSFLAQILSSLCMTHVLTCSYSDIRIPLWCYSFSFMFKTFGILFSLFLRLHLYHFSLSLFYISKHLSLNSVFFFTLSLVHAVA